MKGPKHQHSTRALESSLDFPRMWSPPASVTLPALLPLPSRAAEPADCLQRRTHTQVKDITTRGDLRGHCSSSTSAAYSRSPSLGERWLFKAPYCIIISMRQAHERAFCQSETERTCTATAGNPGRSGSRGRDGRGGRLFVQEAPSAASSPPRA